MYLFFDKNGTLLEVVNDEAKRQYNMNVNRFYVYIQDEDDSITGKINPDIVALQHRYKKSDGTIVDNTTPVQRPIQSGGNPYEDGVFEYKEVPFNRRRDLKHFVYGRKYEFFVVNVPSGIVTEVDYEGDNTTTVEYITEGTVFDVAGTVLATLTAVYQEHSDLVLERFAFTIEESVPTTDGALSGSQFSWIIGELIRMKANASKYLDYNEQNNRPIFNQDLDSAEFSPIENTYYRHIGENETNYTRGLIYYWDGNRYSKIDGGTRIELNGEEVESAKIYAPTKSGNTYQVLLSNGSLAEPVWVNLIVNKNGLEHTIKLGDYTVGTITLPQETYIDSIDYNTATHVVTFEYNGPSGKTDETIDLSDLSNIYTAGNGLQQIGNEFSIKTNSTYLSTSTNGLTVAAQSIADLAKIKLNGSSQIAKSTTFYAPTSAGSSSNILFSNGSGSPSWGSFSVNNGTAKSKSIFAPTSSRSTNSTNSCWVLVPNGSTSAPVWKELTVEKNGLTYTLKLGSIEFGKIELTQEIYLDDVTYDKDNNYLIFTYNTASGKTQIEVDLTDLVDMYEAGNGLVRDNGVFSIKIAPDSEKYLKATAEGLVFDESALSKQDTTGLMLLYDGELSTDITTVDSTQVTIPSNHEIAVGDVLFSTLETTYGATAKIVSVSDTTLGVDFVGNVSGSSLIAKTEDEMDTLLIPENVGKLVSYVGEGGGGTENPTAVGDTVTQIYFDTTKSAEEIYAEIQKIPFDENGLFVCFASEPFTSGEYVGIAKMPMEENKFIYLIGNGGFDDFIFAYSEDYTPDEADIGITEWGWQATSPVATLETFTVAQVNGKEIWGSFLSAHENGFASGSSYKKNTLYMVVEEEKEAPEIAVGDTIDTLYFDTSVEPDFSSITSWDKDGLCYFLYCENGEALGVFDMSAQGGVGYVIMHGDSNFLYASEELSSAFMEEWWGEAITVPKGWNADLIANGGVLTLDAPDTVSEINEQDLWSSYISKEPFTGGSGGIIAKPVGAEGGGNTEEIEKEIANISQKVNSMIAPTTTRDANSDGSCYVLAPNGESAPTWERIEVTSRDNLSYDIIVGGKRAGTINLTTEIYLDSVSYNPETKKLTFTYNTESGKASVDIDLSDLEEVQNALIATNETEFLTYQTEENVGKLVTYNGLLYIITEGGSSNAPIAVGDTLDKLYFNTSVTPDFSRLALDASGNTILLTTKNAENFHTTIAIYDLGVITEGAINAVALVDDENGDFFYSTASFELEGTVIAEGWNAELTSSGGVKALGSSFTVLSFNQQDLWSSYISKEQFTGGGGVTASPIPGGSGGDASIDSVEAELVDELSYNDLTDVPIVIGDLDAITPVANTYYKHNGADETTYTKGVIYFYDGSVFKPVTGGGGGVSDVQINGTTIVADGVANIPSATSSVAGVVSTSAQNFQGVKTMCGGINIADTDGSASTQLRSTGTSSGVLWLKGTLLAGNSTTSGERTSYGPSGITFNKSSNSTVEYAELISAVFRNTSAGTSRYGNYYFLNNASGVMMMTPSTWSTGTSGSVTLPSAGLYEVKFSDGAYNYTGTVNWDGTNRSASQSFVHIGADAPARTMTLSVETTGIMTVTAVPMAGGSKESLTEYTISYRKIGIA